MEELQTDALSDYGKGPTTDLDCSKETTSQLNGNDELDDPLDLIENCDNASIGSNSDVWKGSDSEDENIGENPVNNTTEPVTEETENTEELSANQDPEETHTNQDPEETAANQDPGETSANQDPGETSANQDPEETSTNQDPMPSKSPPSTSIEPAETDNEKATMETADSVVDATNLPKDNESEEPKLPETNERECEKVVQETEANGTAEAEPDLENEIVHTLIEKDPLAPGYPGDAIAKPVSRDAGNVDEDIHMDYDADDDDDFDPSLLCPEVSMDVEDNPVITNSGPTFQDSDGNPSTSSEPMFSTFIDDVTGVEITFNLTVEEQELRRRLYGPTNPIQRIRIHCTACNTHLGSALVGQENRFVHPLLKVLICKSCYHFYTSGDFDKDEDGSELYCRWCGQGGQVLCCSKCEFVFCKRCIRTNFGRKKMFEIRDSDSWDCFRCNTGQIITQRIACFEFFEYIRRELARGATLKTPEIWNTDYSRCCANKKRHAETPEQQEAKKIKKRKLEMDPDYNPMKDKLQQLAVDSTSAGASSITLSNLLAKPVTNAKNVQLVTNIVKNNKDSDIEFVRHIPAPQVVINPVRPSLSAITQFRTILPCNIRPPGAPPYLRVNPHAYVPPLAPTSRMLNTPLPNALQNRYSANSSMMKHEWFEKTVRAAARVNSHLSYTLTQLNKAQSQAASVEELAVVHNKLQEILSSSINSLIQIRKNLRSEFIAGIKTVRLPSKKPETFNNDDDVIFVSSPSAEPTPSTSSVNPIAVDVHSTKTSEMTNSSPPQKGYLKVKSVFELQNVPSECITIPDDVPPVRRSKSPSKDVVCNGSTTETTQVAGIQPPISCDNEKEDKGSATIDKEKNENFNGPKLRKGESVAQVFDINSEPTVEVKRMMTVKVQLERANLEDLQKKLPHGCH